MTVNDNHGLDILPLQTRYLTPSSTKPPHKRQYLCQVNTIPLIDEYAVNIYEDKLDRENHSLDDPDKDVRLVMI